VVEDTLRNEAEDETDGTEDGRMEGEARVQNRGRYKYTECVQ